MEYKGKKLKLHIWDTSGAERFRNINANYYQSANGFLLLYKITDRNSFGSIDSWLNQIEKNSNINKCKILVGTNCDLGNERKVTTQEGKDYATSKGMKFIDVSARQNINVNEAFQILIEDIINSNPNTNEVEDEKFQNSVPNVKKDDKCNIC